MKYPEFLKKGDTIGFCAPSDGDADEIGMAKLDSAVLQMEARGYALKETASTRKSEGGRSADGKIRGEEFMELVKDPAVKSMFAVSGGDWLFEMLEHVDFEAVAANPTWFEGMSDPTGLTYTITTMADVASIYCANAGEFGMQPWDETLKNNFRILEGEDLVQKSSESFQSGWLEYATGHETYNLDSKTSIVRLDKDEPVKVSGRLLGGCMDVLVGLCGTRFDRTCEFVKKYKEDGILWYLEVFAMSPEQISMYLWKFKQAGWFENAAGFLFGRPCMVLTEYSETSYEDAIMSVLGPLEKPVITGLDIGHRPPHWTVVNGAVGELDFADGRATLIQKLI